MKNLILILFFVPIILIGQQKMSNGTVSVSASGDLTYNFIHAVGSADSISYSVGGTQNVYYKINTGAFTWREADGITGTGDSAKILTAGDYEVQCWLCATTSNANDKVRVRLYVNNSRIATSVGRFLVNSEGTGNCETLHFMWYKTFNVNDWLSIRASNMTGGRAVSVTDFKIYIKKLPE